MKQLISFVLAIFAALGVSAQSEKYTAAMKQNIAELDSTSNAERLGELSNNFERIGAAEKVQWLPYYYAAYCTVMTTLTSGDKSLADGIADKAEQLIRKAEEINGKENSETCVIKSMIACAHMMVDPQSRFMQYGAVSALNISKAKQLDPSNPRPVYLEGQARFFTPEQFGGGKAPAKILFIKALEMFDQFRPATELHPSWGRGATKYFLAQCN